MKACVCVCVCFRDTDQRWRRPNHAFLPPHGPDSCAAAVWASVRKCVCQERRVGGVVVCVCVSESERQKSSAVIYAPPPTPQFLAAVSLLRFADMRKKKKAVHHQTFRRLERGRGWEWDEGGARKSNMINTFVFTCALTTDWSWEEKKWHPDTETDTCEWIQNHERAWDWKFTLDVGKQ